MDFADSSINYKLLFWVRNPLEAFAVGSDLRQAIWTAFDKNGIGIPFPQRQVYPMECPARKTPSKEIKPTGRCIGSKPTGSAISNQPGRSRQRSCQRLSWRDAVGSPPGVRR